MQQKRLIAALLLCHYPVFCLSVVWFFLISLLFFWFCLDFEASSLSHFSSILQGENQSQHLILKASKSRGLRVSLISIDFELISTQLQLILNWFQLSLIIGFELVSIDFNLCSIDFNLLPIYFEVTSNLFWTDSISWATGFID